MPYFVFAALLAYPFLEILSLVWLAGQIGLIGVLLFLILSFLAGVTMLRFQKIGVGAILFSELRSGRFDVSSLLRVARYYIAAILLIIPGLIGDILALLLLLPWGRQPAAAARVDDGIIEAEYRKVEPEQPPRIERQ